MYEGGKVVDLKVVVDRWSYFELLDYSEIETIYYRDPKFGLNVLVGDKGALDIVDLFRVLISVNIYIQHYLSEIEYYDDPFDEIEVNYDDIVDEGE